ncbi:hypothetical protein GCM10010400_75530 [Streptomyces aculeolatus]
MATHHPHTHHAGEIRWPWISGPAFTLLVALLVAPGQKVVYVYVPGRTANIPGQARMRRGFAPLATPPSWFPTSGCSRTTGPA